MSVMIHSCRAAHAEKGGYGRSSIKIRLLGDLGGEVHSTTVDRQAERVEEDGSVVVETVPVRRTAYYLPKKIRNILNGDAEVLSYARASKRTMGGDEEEPEYVDIYKGAWKKYGFVIAIKLVYDNETVFAFARGKTWEDRWLGVSRDNPAPTGEFVETIERYDKLEDAFFSRYYIGMRVAEELLGSIFFGTVDPDKVELPLLQMGPLF